MGRLRYLLDTNICIYVHRKRPPEVLGRFEKLTVGDAAISVITYGELLYGAHQSSQRSESLTRLSDLVSLLPVLDMPATVGEAYGEIRAAFETLGMPIGGNDLWIAAHARAAGLVLVTNNEREFKRVPGLKVQNWAAKA